MAGSSSTVTYDEGVDGNGRAGGIRKILIDWTSDDTTGSVVATTKKIVGRLVKGITDPGATAPTDNYDIAITDGEGVDVLGNCESTLANRDTANTEEVYFLVKNGTPTGLALHPAVCDVLTVTVTNAGNSKVGQLILFYEPCC